MASASSTKQPLAVALIGSRDGGKTAIAGHLCVFGGGVSQRVRDLYDNPPDRYTHPQHVFVKRRCSRELPYVSDVTHSKFVTDRFTVHQLDCCGHRDFVKNTLRGLALADVAVVVYSMQWAEYVGKIDVVGREHMSIARSFGITQFVVAISYQEHDDATEETFSTMCAAITKHSKRLGVTNLTFVPVKPGYVGLNIVETTKEWATWYTGRCLRDAIDSVVNTATNPYGYCDPDGPFRFCVYAVFRIGGVGTVVTGKVLSGSLSTLGVHGRLTLTGDKVMIASAEVEWEPVQSVSTGTVVGLHLMSVSHTKVVRGDILTLASEPMAAVESFVASVTVVDHPSGLVEGCELQLFCRTRRVQCKITELISVTMKGGKDKDKSGTSEDTRVRAPTGSTAFVRIQPLQPIVLAPYDEARYLGTIALRERQTVALGKVNSVVYK